MSTHQQRQQANHSYQEYTLQQDNLFMPNQSIHEEPAAEQLARDSIYEAEGEQSSIHVSQENLVESLKKQGGNSPRRNH